MVEAISRLNEAIFLKPTDASLYVRRADACLAMCDLSTALANLTKAVTLTEHRDRALVERLAHVLDARGLCLMDDADYTGAITMFNQAIALVKSPGLVESGPEISAVPVMARSSEKSAKELGAAAQNFVLHRALAYIGMGSIPAAVHDLHQLTSMADSTADANFLLARMQLKAGALFDARRNQMIALKLDPNHAHARALGRLMERSAKVYEEEATRLMLLGHAAQAIANLTNAISLDPQNPLLFKKRALAHKQTGDAAAAVADLEQAVSLSGGAFPDAEKLLTVVCNEAAIAEVARGRPELALELMLKAISRDETSARFFANRAEIELRLGKEELALEDFARARALCAADSPRRDDALAWEIECKVSLIHYKRGTKLFNRTDYTEAFAAFSRAIECNPRVAQYHLSRAEVATTLKRWDVVRADAEAALSLNPSDPRARSVLSRVVPA